MVISNFNKLIFFINIGDFINYLGKDCQGGYCVTTGNENMLVSSLGRLYFGRFVAAANADNGVKAAGQVALGVNNLPFSLKCMRDSWNAAKDVSASANQLYNGANGSTVNALNMIKNNPKDFANGALDVLRDPTVLYNTKVLDSMGYHKLNDYHFFFDDTYLGKAINNTNFAQKSQLLSKLGSTAKALDKNMFDICGEQVVKKLGGEVAKSSADDVAKVFIKGSAKAAFAGNVLGKIPLVGVAISSLLEVPSIIKGFKNNDGWEQVGRSTLNVAGGIGGSAIGATLLAPVIPPIGSLVGLAVGGWIGNKVAGFMGNKLIGEPKEKNPAPQEMNNQILPQIDEEIYTISA